MVLFFQAISFVLLNIAFGLMFVYFLRIVLFHPSRAWYIGKFRIPLTPSLFFQQKAYWTKKVYDLLERLIDECHTYDYDSTVSKLERKVYQYVLEKLDVLEDIQYLPVFIAKTVKRICAQICFELFRHFIRSFVPFLVEKYNVESYIDLLNEKISVYVLRDYYVRYVHRFLFHTAFVLFFLLGLYNMIVFLIVR